MESAHNKKRVCRANTGVANKTDISAPVEGADAGMSTLTGEGVEAVLEMLLGMLVVGA